MSDSPSSFDAPATEVSRRFVMGCDIGGTFTDFVLYDAAARCFSIDKRLTTPRDPGAAVLAGAVGFRAGDEPVLHATDRLVHGTTLGINALLERKGAPTALLVTAGFRDILEIRRGTRGELWDLSGRLPDPLIARKLRLEIPERIDAAGRVLEPLAADAVRRALDHCVAEGITSVAVCFLHAYQNPVHERQVRELARTTHPGLSISLSSDVLPQLGEFERFSATAANAYLRPVMERYLPRLEGTLLAHRLRQGGLRLLSSEGSQCSTAVAKEYPIRVVESGPVGGVLAARHFGTLAGMGEVLTLDIGGTTAKTCLLADGELPIAEEYEVARVYRFAPGSGLPLNVPSVDLLEIGAGGGSIAWIGPLGMVEIGPESAGADPGPACYANGGNRPTLTDADVTLGLLDPASFRAIGRPVEAPLAHAAIRDAIATPLGRSVADAALLIRQVAIEKMASAISLQLAHVGADPRRLALVAFGGAGPLYATELARRANIPVVIIPPLAAVFSALGMVMAPPAYTATRSFVAAMDALAPEVLEQAFRELERTAADAVASGGVADPAAVSHQRQMELRYRGQGRSLRVAAAAPATRQTIAEVVAAFHHEYARRFGSAQHDQAVQLTALRVTATLPVGALPDDAAAAAGTGTDPGVRRRPIFAGTAAATTADVVARSAIDVTVERTGPALVEENGSTTYIGAGARYRADTHGNLVIVL